MWNEGTQLAMGVVLLASLVAVTATDLQRRIIPNSILIAAAATGLAIAAAGDPAGLDERIIGAVATGGFFLLAALISPRGMGMGDVKLAALIGFFLGRAAAPAILVALLAGAAVGASIITLEGLAGRKQTVPFGPFLALGAVVGMVAGEEMLDWYLETCVNLVP